MFIFCMVAIIARASRSHNHSLAVTGLVLYGYLVRKYPKPSKAKDGSRKIIVAAVFGNILMRRA